MVHLSVHLSVPLGFFHPDSLVVLVGDDSGHSGPISGPTLGGSGLGFSEGWGVTWTLFLALVGRSRYMGPVMPLTAQCPVLSAQCLVHNAPYSIRGASI